MTTMNSHAKVIVRVMKLGIIGKPINSVTKIVVHLLHLDIEIDFLFNHGAGLSVRKICPVADA